MFEELPKFNLKLHRRNKRDILEINVHITKHEGATAMPMICVREETGLNPVRTTEWSVVSGDSPQSLQANAAIIPQSRPILFNLLLTNYRSMLQTLSY
jgi:hypothetical protein